MKALNRYQTQLENLPPSGGGGCHQALLGVANYGACAGVDPQKIFDDIRLAVHGSRRVSDREIRQAIEKAMVDKGQIINYDFKSKKRAEPKPSFDGVKARQRIIDAGAGITEADIWSASPVKIDWAPEEDPLHLLHFLYRPDDQLFIGERYSPGIISKTIRTTASWQQYFSKGGKTYPHIIPNPLSGHSATTAAGNPSLRADACIRSFRFAVVEFDDMTREDQLGFWWGVHLPVAALIDSGKKSVHGWIRTDGVDDADSWTREVEDNLFKNILIPLGVDGACRNEARLSRLPGHKRANGRMQRLLYLAPEGRRISG